jgi:DNA-directed RNA polymerase subunit RPC12/RpoP
MPIIFHCPECGREIRVRIDAAGRKGRCVDCDAIVVVPHFTEIGRRSQPKFDVLPSNPEIPTVNHGFEDDDQPPS